MSVIDNTTLPKFIGISESQYKEFMREIKAMKPNKRKNWKNYLTDKWGTRTRCKYRNGKIYNWSLIASELMFVFVDNSYTDRHLSARRGRARHPSCALLPALPVARAGPVAVREYSGTAGNSRPPRARLRSRFRAPRACYVLFP